MKRILHVEGEKVSAEVCRKILESDGHQVDRALTGKEGLRRIRKDAYDLALLDVRLPDMSAWDFYKKAKDTAAKFVFLSALAISEEHKRTLRKSGLRDYIVKPYTKKDLTERIRKVLRKRQCHRD